MSAMPSFKETELMPSLQAAYAALATPTAAQVQAWNSFLQVGLPSLRDEKWKYTQLQRLYAHKFALPDLQLPNGVEQSKASELLCVIDGQLQCPAEVFNGIHITTRAMQANNSDASFAALNAALAPHEIVITVSDNVIIEQPLDIEFTTTSEYSSMVYPRVTIQLGRNSRLTLLESHGSTNDLAHFNNAVMQIELADGALLEHCRIQCENSASFQIGKISAKLAKHAQYINHQYNLGASLSRIDIDVRLEGAESYAELNGLQFAVDTQLHDTHSIIEHCVAHTRSAETYHGIADGRGQVVFNGKVMVHKHAIGTDAQQSSRNLLLSPKAEIDTKPELEIYADDVKCSHGATVGQLDTTALFYLRSRGIGEQQARGMLTLAFADAVINRVPVPAVRDELTALVHARFNTSAEIAS